VANTNDLRSESLLAQQDGLETARIRMNVDLHEDGSARWTVEYWSVLDDDNSTAAFESLQADIATDPDGYATDFADRITETVSTAQNSTGREMSAQEFSVETEQQSVSRAYGIVRYSFEWSGFARTADETLYAGDAIDGLFLDDGTRLLVSWPAGYDLQSSTPEPDAHRKTAAIWRGGSTEFLTGEPRLTLAPPAGGIGTGMVAVGLIGVAATLGVAGWLLRRRSTEGPADSQPTTAADTQAAAPSSETTTTESTAESDSSHSTAAEPTADPEADSETDSEPDPALLSNEEQVMRLLEANGGRMKQQTVVTELEWTDAKTSKVVSTLREEGALESFRIGRENVLTVPDEDDSGLEL